MAQAKKGLNGIVIAVSLLMATLAQFSIIAVIKKYTGYTVPKWLAYLIYGVAAAIVVSILARYGIYIPKWVANAVRGLGVNA